MMGYSIKVSTDDVAAKATAVSRQVSDLESQLATLSSDMSALAASWNGKASDAFQTLYHGWNKQAGQIQQSLNDIGISLKGAGSKYADAEAANISSMGHS
jgi:early secretory antigenic target protein ESAT-6